MWPTPVLREWWPEHEKAHVGGRGEEMREITGERRERGGERRERGGERREREREREKEKSGKWPFPLLSVTVLFPLEQYLIQQSKTSTARIYIYMHTESGVNAAHKRGARQLGKYIVDNMTF